MYKHGVDGGGSPCRMSFIRNANVTISNLRKPSVALSILKKPCVALRFYESTVSHVAKA